MNPYQFQYDGSPEAKEAIRLINEKPDFLSRYDGMPNRYYTSDIKSKSDSFPDHDLLTPAQFVARMKEESEKCQQSEPTKAVATSIEKCLEIVTELNKHHNLSEQDLKNRANWLFMFNRLNFWEDMPILIELIKYESNKIKNKNHGI